MGEGEYSVFMKISIQVQVEITPPPKSVFDFGEGWEGV